MKCIFLILLAFFTLKTSACELTVRLEEYSAQSRLLNGKWHGIDVALATALLTDSGCSFKFIVLPWGRALKMLEQGGIDMMLSVSKTNEREQFAHFIGPERIETIVFAGIGQSSSINTLEQLLLLEKPIALQRGAFYGEAFTKLIYSLEQPAKHFIYTTNNRSKADLIKTKRVSGFLEARLNIEFELANSDELDDVIIHPVIINRAPVYYAFSKSSINEELLAKLTESYNKLSENGTFDKIFKQYKVSGPN